MIFLILVLLALLVLVLWWALASTPKTRRRVARKPTLATDRRREPFDRSDVDVLVPRHVRREHERHDTWVSGCPLCEHEIRVAHERKERA